MSNLQNFIAATKQISFSKQNHFIAMIPFPKELLDIVGLDLETLALYCHTVNIPSFAIQTSTIKTFGNPFEIPTNGGAGSFSAAFYVDNDMRIKQLFDLWIHSIYNQKTGRIAWMNDVTTDNIEIRKLDIENNTVYIYKLMEVYPKVVNNVELSYSNTDIMSLTVEFSYQALANAASEQVESLMSYQFTYGDKLQTQLNNNSEITFNLQDANASRDVISYFDKLKANNSWIDKTFEAAGKILGAYQSAENVYSDVTGAYKKVKELAGAVRNSKDLKGVINAGTGILSVIKNNPIQRIPGQVDKVVNTAGTLTKQTLNNPFE